ncbi:hypothetical protein OBBRIDRAFT_527858 [Obba rivulosa]|uniref:Uncharacterized protein n=1 Tax=Obba rivulosa TaxID=1052685 RepID=A0A8E2AUV3_9APHY|nr:hypothetical protein OBBRIDRAFT_527858 [Obba rivulosa]
MMPPRRNWTMGCLWRIRIARYDEYKVQPCDPTRSIQTRLMSGWDFDQRQYRFKTFIPLFMYVATCVANSRMRMQTSKDLSPEERDPGVSEKQCFPARAAASCSHGCCDALIEARASSRGTHITGANATTVKMSIFRGTGTDTGECLARF